MGPISIHTLIILIKVAYILAMRHEIAGHVMATYNKQNMTGDNNGKHDK